MSLRSLQAFRLSVHVNANQYYTGLLCLLKAGNCSFVILITYHFFNLPLQSEEVYKLNNQTIPVLSLMAVDT